MAAFSPVGGGNEAIAALELAMARADDPMERLAFATRWAEVLDGQRQAGIAGAREKLLAGTPRPTTLGRHLIDLSPYYNASRHVRTLWHDQQGDYLDEVPEILTSFRGIRYDARGIIQINSGVYPDGTGNNLDGLDFNQFRNRNDPDEIRIAIEQICTAPAMDASPRRSRSSWATGRR